MEDIMAPIFLDMVSLYGKISMNYSAIIRLFSGFFIFVVSNLRLLTFNAIFCCVTVRNVPKA